MGGIKRKFTVSFIVYYHHLLSQFPKIKYFIYWYTSKDKHTIGIQSLLNGKGRKEEATGHLDPKWSGFCPPFLASSIRATMDRFRTTKAPLCPSLASAGLLIRYSLFLCLHFTWLILTLLLFIYLAASHGIFDLHSGVWDHYSCMQTFSCGMWRGMDPWPGIEPGSPALGAQSHSHWTTRVKP